MPIYGDDECEKCGGIRVAKSMLCADCLVTRCHRLNEQRMDLKLTIESLKKEVKNSHGRLEDALAYGFKKNQENGRLLARCRELEELMIRRL